MDLKCECGGELQSATLRDFDFSAYAGLPVKIVEVPGLRCSNCKGETLDGEVINAILERLSLEIIRMNRRLGPLEMKFLRKRMRLTQAKLAEQMGIVRETLADWERGASTISPQYDLLLRAIFSAHLMNTSDKQSLGSVVDVVARSIQSVRQSPAVLLPAPYIIEEALMQMRSSNFSPRGSG